MARTWVVVNRREGGSDEIRSKREEICGAVAAAPAAMTSGKGGGVRGKRD